MNITLREMKKLLRVEVPEWQLYALDQIEGLTEDEMAEKMNTFGQCEHSVYVKD